MKRIGAVILLLTFVCCSFTACAQSLESTIEEQTTLTESNDVITEQDLPTAVIYKVEPMQNVNYCTYFEDGETPLVFSGEASRFFGKIYVTTQCGNCGTKDISSHLLDPNELDFSDGNTAVYSNSEQCSSCYWDKDIQQFMWTVRVTRLTVRVCAQCGEMEPAVTFSSETAICDGCNYNSQGGSSEEKLICSQCGADCSFRGLEEDGRCEDCFSGD